MTISLKLIKSAVLRAALECNFPPHVSIWVDPKRLSGAPCFKGTPVPVDSLFNNLESSLRLDEYLDSFPDVTRGQAIAVLEYAHKNLLQAA